jgi:hypothetical protein
MLRRGFRVDRSFGTALAFLALAGCFAVVGCGGVTNANSGTPIIAVSMKQDPPATLLVGSTASVSATVADDPANAGIDWVAMCGSAPACGSFSPSHTASGSATMYRAPVGVPAGAAVTVTALSSTDHSKTAGAPVTIISTVTGVTITQPPPANYPAGGSFGVAASVAGDPSNEGVDWKASCGGVDCTSGFTGGTHSAPGVPTTFTVPLPAAFPTIIGSTITLTAFATADHTFSASAMSTVTQAISIAITQPPPADVLTNAAVPMIATVSNDPTNAGVTWTVVNCDLSPCGSWSTTLPILNTQTASAATVDYIAPATPVGHVMIRAAATASPLNATTTVEFSVIAPISVAITQGVTNDTIVKAGTAALIATVTGDTASRGVDWTVTCGTAGACGSFSPPHTASGAVSTYTAPASAPTGGSVTITATSTADTTKQASETVTVTSSLPPDTLLEGQWILQLSGRDANGGPFALGGAISGDGAGNITGGSVDLEDLGSGVNFYNAGNVSVQANPASTYSIGSDGRGRIQLSLSTGNLNGSFGVGGSGLVTLSVVFVTKSHAFISENDSFGIGVGTLDLQNVADLDSFQHQSAGPNGQFSLTLHGAEVASPYRQYFVAGGLGFTYSGSGFSETSYVADQSDKGAITSVAFHAQAGSAYALPNTFGEMSLASVKLGLANQFNLDLWMIDKNHYVVTDIRDLFFASPSVIISGYLTAQSSATALSGPYAFTKTGMSSSFVAQAAGGIFTCGGSGIFDFTPLGGSPVDNQAVTVVCSSPSGSGGRSTITITGTGTTGVSQFAAYPTVDGQLYLLEVDRGPAGTSGPSGFGMAQSQTLAVPISASSFKGDYASSFFALTSLGSEAFAGQANSDGVSKITGTLDVNTFATATPPLGAATPSSEATLSGSFTAGTNGRFPLASTIVPATGQPAPEFTHLNPACYVVSPSTCLLLGLDATAPGSGLLELQNTGVQ